MKGKIEPTLFQIREERGRKGQNKIGFSKEIDRLIKMYKPSLTEFIDELKRVFPFTYKSHIKE